MVKKDYWLRKRINKKTKLYFSFLQTVDKVNGLLFFLKMMYNEYAR